MNIQPISELKNYNTILSEVKVGEPMYLTKNGKGLYIIFDINEAEDYQEYKVFKNSVENIPLHDKDFFIKDIEDLKQKLITSIKNSKNDKNIMEHDEFWSKISNDYAK